MRFFLRSLLLSSLVVCSSCASLKAAWDYQTEVAVEAMRSPQDKKDEVMRSWENGDINNLISSWGIPSNEYVMPNGSKIYSWLWVGSTFVTVGYVDILNQAYANQTTPWCRNEFTVSPAGIITFWRYEGNGCY